MAEEGSAQAELRVRLVIDDQSAEVTEKLKQNLGGAHEKAHATGLSASMIAKGMAMGSIAADALKETVGAVGEGLHSAYELMARFVETSIEAAAGEDEQVRSMSGLVFLLDKGQHSMAAITQYAGEMHDELEEAGRKVGQTDTMMTDMFNTIVSRGHMATEKAKELTEQMAEVGRITQGGMRGLGEGFAMMEMGMIRARNPLVQLIAATGMLKGNAHDVAKAMMKMTPEKQMELAEAAIRKQADAMRSGGGMALTLGEMKTSLSGYREMFFESVGHPILGVLMPALGRVQHWLGENREAIVEYATSIGHSTASLVQMMESAFGGMARGLWYNWGEITTMLDRVLGDWRDAFNYSEGKTKGIHTMFRDMTTWLVEASETFLRYSKAAAEVWMNVKDFFKGDVVGTSQATTLEQSMRERSQQVGDPAAMARFDETAAKWRDMAAEVGKSDEYIERTTAALREQLEVGQRMGESVKEDIAVGRFDEVSAMINEAVNNNQVSSQAYYVSLIAASDTAMHALQTGAIHVNEGMDALIKSVGDKSPEVAEAFKQAMVRLQGGAIKDIAGKGALNFNMYGTHIHIQQDFKNEDPDRIVLIMRRDIMQSATARVQARTQSPFGL
jgi:hypothetical protein